MKAFIDKCKIGWINTKGFVDYYKSGINSETQFGTIFLGTVLGGVITLATAIIKDEGRFSAASSVEDQIDLRQGGHIVRFPDNCGLDDDIYLLYKEDNVLQIGRGRSGGAFVKPLDEQQDIQDDIRDCMDDMSDWIAKGNMNFMEELHYADVLEYSSPIVIQDAYDGDQELLIDIMETSDGFSKSLDKNIKKSDAYDDEADNRSLYVDAFSKLEDAWAPYDKNDIKKQFYYDGQELKATKTLPVYEYKPLRLTDLFYSVGAGLLIVGGVLFGPGGYRDSGYHKRAEQRQKAKANIKTVQGLDHTSF